jgi:signal transduction histidine kinase
VSYPAFIAEMALPSSREKLRYSVRSGYVLAGLFALLAVAGPVLDLVPFRSGFYLLVGLKLVTNTFTLASLRHDRFVLEASGLNVMADVACMTGAIYLTGGIASPLLAIYAIEITVVALLTNLGVTVLVASTIVLAYGAMVLAVHAGAIPAVPPPRAISEGADTAFVVTGIVFAAFVVGAPTFFVARILAMLREKERALERKNAELVEAGQQQSLLLANVTHELRTPIHGICGLSDLVESGVYGPVSERQKTAHEEIKKSAHSLLRLIDDLLEVVRADAGKLELSREEVHLHELLPSVLGSMGAVVGTRPLELVLDLRPDLAPIMTDRAKLTQILVNLLANAVKFTPDGGTITLGARQSAAHSELFVSDTGNGIAPADQQRIFEAFRQIDGSAEREYGGVGLGLAVAERLAQLLGAEIRVESELGKGATFTVSLPRAAATHRAA